MGTQNKLPEGYLPDKGARKEKVIIALSGGLDSLVSAYLLKIQKYELLAVTIVPGGAEFGEARATTLSCAVTEQKLEAIEAFTHQLGIPHFVVRLSGEFRDRVIDRWVSRKALGQYPDQCLLCHDLRMDVLHHKMKELGGKFLATGHFAKVFRQDPNGQAVVQTSNDEVHDQSALLSRLPQEILQVLLLPLSDLQKKEVGKLAENFGLTTGVDKLPFSKCLSVTEVTEKFLEGELPERFRKDGEVADGEDNRVGDHEGVFRHTPGKIVIPSERKDPLLFSRYVPAEKKIIVRSGEWFLRDRVVLRNCSVPIGTPWGSPFRGVLVRGANFFEGWFYPKTLTSCAVELDEKASLLEGEVLHVLRKKGRNSRVLLSGSVKFVQGPGPEGDESVKVDYALDF